MRDLFAPTDAFAPRHLGPNADEVEAMLAVVGVPTLAALIDETIPAEIRRRSTLNLPPPLGERAALARLRQLADRNVVRRSMIGMGYFDCVTPPVIQRNILENPGWYTQYTPYQAEISQGRMEALVNFQTMIADLTDLPLTNASLLDEATAAAEAMSMCAAVARHKRTVFLVADDCHPQTIAVVQTRAKSQGITIKVGDPATFVPNTEVFGILLQTPTTDGRIVDYRPLIQAAHAAKAMVVVASDLLALTQIRSPGEEGADIAIGSCQRFGVPLGFGGPHAAFLATQDRYKRQMPGRIIGVSKDTTGQPAYRLALQTREQHIRRDRATSNICTSQVLLAVMAGMYAVYHGPDGLRRISRRVHALTRLFAEGLASAGYSKPAAPYFDTLKIKVDDSAATLARADAAEINLRDYGDGHIGISFDETCDLETVTTLLGVFKAGEAQTEGIDGYVHASVRRSTDYLSHPVFHSYRSEHEMLRYLSRLQGKDLSLVNSMIPLGSCTMKLNGTTEMMPITWPGFSDIHPFAPPEQSLGYQELFAELQSWLGEITGFDAVSLQPNAGSQGEYTGLLVIQAYHQSRGDTDRNICLIPTSAHGTNPASAVMAGLKVVTIKSDARGDIDLVDLKAKAIAHADHLAAAMITYPSTHGVFEPGIRAMCEIIHAHGGLVYMDGANMNAQVGLSRPGDMGADVCHLNLHKTFCIPHGGGGPGVGPIGVTATLAPFLPGHPVVGLGGSKSIGPIAAAPYGSPGILPISYTYIAMMGADGLTQATQTAILNANYMAARLRGHYDILFTGIEGRVAHEFILDCRDFHDTAGIGVDDIAKRLMDFGFHAPTMSWPVTGTLMVEPTESESKAELDRFCDAMITIRAEIQAIIDGVSDPEDNALRHAPHTVEAVSATEWPHAYSREQAAYPRPWVRSRKFWPAVSRIDNVFGDRHLVCSCPPIEAYGEK